MKRIELFEGGVSLRQSVFDRRLCPPLSARASEWHKPRPLSAVTWLLRPGAGALSGVQVPAESRLPPTYSVD